MEWVKKLERDNVKKKKGNLLNADIEREYWIAVNWREAEAGSSIPI